MAKANDLYIILDACLKYKTFDEMVYNVDLISKKVLNTFDCGHKPLSEPVKVVFIETFRVLSPPITESFACTVATLAVSNNNRVRKDFIFLHRPLLKNIRLELTKGRELI